MAKGQLRSSREPKKPKKPKQLAMPATQTIAHITQPQQQPHSAKGKHH